MCKKSLTDVELLLDGIPATFGCQKPCYMSFPFTGRTKRRSSAAFNEYRKKRGLPDVVTEG